MAGDDRELIDTLRAGDEAAFARLVATHQPGFVRVARVWVKDADAARRAARLVLRGGLVALLAMWGAFKFTALEAEAIRPLVEHSPFLSWLYPVLGIRGASDLIGVVELAARRRASSRRTIRSAGSS